MNLVLIVVGFALFVNFGMVFGDKCICDIEDRDSSNICNCLLYTVFFEHCLLGLS